MKKASVAVMMPVTLNTVSASTTYPGQTFFGVAGSARLQPEQEAGGNHHAAREPGQEIQPAQRPVVKLNAVQARDEALHRHYRLGPEAVQDGAAGGVEIHLVQVHG